jgi:hypothetical protein
MIITGLNERNRQAILENVGGIEFEKAHIKQHQRKSKSGKLSNVKEHEDKRQSLKKQITRAQELLRKATGKKVIAHTPMKLADLLDDNFTRLKGKEIREAQNLIGTLARGGKEFVEPTYKALVQSAYDDVIEKSHCSSGSAVMEKYSSGNLHSGKSKKKVKSRKQAMAIASSVEAKKALVDNIVEDLIEKAHVKQHMRKSKKGKLGNVKEHEDKRQRHQEEEEFLGHNAKGVSKDGYHSAGMWEKEEAKKIAKKVGGKIVADPSGDYLVKLRSKNDYEDKRNKKENNNDLRNRRLVKNLLERRKRTLAWIKKDPTEKSDYIHDAKILKRMASLIKKDKANMAGKLMYSLKRSERSVLGKNLYSALENLED